MKKEDIIRKIEGLLATAKGNASYEESQTAFLLARKLMAKHDIDAMELEGKSEKATLFEGIVEFDINEPKILRWYEVTLAMLVSKHFKVKLLRNNAFGRGRKVLAFYGYEEDCDFAREIYFMALNAMLEHTKEYLELYYITDGRYIKKTAKHTNEIKDSYMNGFISGLDTAFEEQNKEIFEEYGIMLTTNEIVNQRFEEHTKGYKTSSVASKQTVNTDAYFEGLNDGKSQNVQAKKRIEG